MAFDRNPLDDPQWLRIAIWLLVERHGGLVDLDIAPAIQIANDASIAGDQDVGQLVAQYTSDTTLRLMTKRTFEAEQAQQQLDLLPPGPDVKPN